MSKSKTLPQLVIGILCLSIVSSCSTNNYENTPTIEEMSNYIEKININSIKTSEQNLLTLKKKAEDLIIASDGKTLDGNVSRSDLNSYLPKVEETLEKEAKLDNERSIISYQKKLLNVTDELTNRTNILQEQFNQWNNNKTTMEEKMSELNSQIQTNDNNSSKLRDDFLTNRNKQSSIESERKEIERKIIEEQRRQKAIADERKQQQEIARQERLREQQQRSQVNPSPSVSSRNVDPTDSPSVVPTPVPTPTLQQQTPENNNED